VLIKVDDEEEIFAHWAGLAHRTLESPSTSISSSISFNLKFILLALDVENII